jgi:hypothetical protein
MAERLFKVMELGSGETCAVFGADQRNFAITLADSLAARASAGERYVVIEETVIHETMPPQRN